MLAKRYLVSGIVQGVGFRYFVAHQAHVLRIAGNVRNLPNGSVEAFAQGTKEALDAFETALQEGPSHARVDNVDVKSEEVGAHSGFEILV